MNLMPSRVAVWWAVGWMLLAGAGLAFGPARLFGAWTARGDLSFYYGAGGIAILAAALAASRRPAGLRIASVIAVLAAVLFVLLATSHPPGFAWVDGFVVAAFLSAAAARAFWRAGGLSHP